MGKMDMVKLEELASGADGGGSQEGQRLQNVKKRSEAVRVFVRRRADGTCEACGSPAPFTDRNGWPYLEAHHIYRRADEGPDHPDSVIALCPNCHRRVHPGQDGDRFNRQLALQLAEGGSTA